MPCKCELCKVADAAIILNGVFQLCWDCYCLQAKRQTSTIWKPWPESAASAEVGE